MIGDFKIWPAIVLIACWSCGTHATLLAYDISFEGDFGGTGRYAFQTGGINQFVSWDWDLGDGRTGSMDLQLLNSLNTELRLDIHRVVIAETQGASFGFGRDAIIGYPATISIPTRIGDRLLDVFTFGAGIDGRGFWHIDADGTVAQGRYDMYSQSVPEPSSVVLLMVGVATVGLSLFRRRCAPSLNCHPDRGA